MKYLKNIAILAPLFIISCVGQVEPAGESQLTIEVSKPQISVAEGESVEIKVKNWGDNITDEAQIFYTYAGEKTALDASEFTASKAGEYTFTATYKDQECHQSVTVRAYTDDELTDTFFRRHLVMKLTGTWCVNCPMMGDVLTELEHKMPFELVEIAIHDDEELRIAAGKEFILANNYIFLPTVVVDMDTENEITKSSGELVSSAIANSANTNPTVSGVRISSKLNSNKVDIEVGVIATTAGDYKLAVALVADNYHYPQTGASSPLYKQNKVLRSVVSNLYGDSIDALSVNTECVKSYQMELPADLKGDCRVVAYLLNQTSNGQYRVNNVTECEVGHEIDYIYNLK